ncbi:putative lipoprotein [Leptospira yanagawae serovar Saopaulo str. Sao Paulo = ATCC 700523]|uniref:Putative lipoprotein n=1 Tax=Leptospira yanagawae serovar Saopaulo str. Sao Paulo = ATCC 700523 TaxID=1249483 RepID=A0A5E8HJD3_9LEPT|nr:hypothetical protein [Leptospira yanagawae]EOQ89936.1 putative lipoprotein [Leptospira yanagawae serovar Saopaulo str. Sao Paulo = ATCC 700523]
MKLSSIFYIFLLLLISCFESGKDLQKKQEENQTWILTTLYWQRNFGNCIKTDSNTNTKTCSRRPLGVCNHNQLIVTQAEVNLNLNETNGLLGRTPDCQESILQSGILSLSATTNANSESLKSRYLFQVTESCEGSGYVPSANVRLASFSEIQWLESVRGKIAKAAHTISINGFLPQANRDKANNCLRLEFLEWEKDLAKENVENKVLLEITLP